MTKDEIIAMATEVAGLPENWVENDFNFWRLDADDLLAIVRQAMVRERSAFLDALMDAAGSEEAFPAEMRELFFKIEVGGGK